MKRIHATVAYRGDAVVTINVPDNFTEGDIMDAAADDIEIPMDAEIVDVLEWEDDDAD